MNKLCYKEFVKLERIGSLLVFLFALFAIILSNSSYYYFYKKVLNYVVQIKIFNFLVAKSLLSLVNDGLMIIYFILVGLEVIDILIENFLVNKISILIFNIVVFSGLVFPAFIFFIFNKNYVEYLKGWSIPISTDIVFSSSVINFLNPCVSYSLKSLLTVISVFDDIQSMIVISIFYVKKVPLFLGLFLISIILIYLFYFNFKNSLLFIIIGFFSLFFLFKSGIHGVLSGIIISIIVSKYKNLIFLIYFKKYLKYFVTFFILPIFALVNSGIVFVNFNFSMLLHPIFLGVFFGLLIGKQIGIFLPLFFFIKVKRLLKLDHDVKSLDIYGISLLCGIGFTMSIFIGSISYHYDLYYMTLAKEGIFLGSFCSGILGVFVLNNIHIKRNNNFV
ncbi:hypothetical protein CCU22_00575 [Candidatus Legionella polyplacis]|uniref:Na(+)/H(+) antiporter NhaA n=1 Tax=Candidatus Legionella polyplacis TaxID=2005262 RepID=A0ABZ2H0L9_9GAMM|nr:Na+/H+ antiporter NhaA [Candidatus Legionella polyplacis]ATW01725.1 hypothetical protein CCU22_00575 [Candidatus Legionella polyplacis]